jgi:quercetin dioxygenase-like cupin family protein
MPKVTFDSDQDNLVAGAFSTGRGPVLRSERLEVTRISFVTGKGAREHAHPEEQFVYVLSGRLRVTCAGTSYELGAGEATFNPADVPHAVMALEDTTALSFKNLVAPSYEATGRLACGNCGEVLET